MNQKPNIEKIQQLCIDAILSSDDVNKFIGNVYQELNLPMIVFDETISLITYAYDESFYFEDWAEIVKYGSALPSKEASNFDYQNIIYKNKKPTYVDWGTAMGRPQTCCPIIHNDVLMGYIGISLEDCPYTEDVMNIEAVLADTLGTLLEKSLESKRSEDILSAEDVASILAGDYPDPNAVNTYKRHFNGPYVYAVLRFRRTQEASLENLKTILKRNIPSLLAVLSERENLFMLFPITYFSNLTVLLSKILTQLKIENYHLCVSDTLQNLYQVPSRKKQAVLTLDYCMALKVQNKICHYVDYYLEILSYMFIKKYGYQAAIPYAIRKLAEFDHENGKSYIRTLRCYLDNRMHSSKTAQALAVHPNTLRIRLQKITDIIGADVNNPEICNQLHFALHIMEVAEMEKAIQ